MSEDREFLHRQLIKLGDMMGDGLHYEEDGKWIEKEYRQIYKQLYPEAFRKDLSQRNNAVLQWCASHNCPKCGFRTLKQTRKGSLRVRCQSCDSKFQLKIKKNRS